MTKDDIKKIRKAIGINTSGFGSLIGVSGKAVENYEQGIRKPGGAVVINIKRIKLMHEYGALRLCN